MARGKSEEDASSSSSSSSDSVESGDDDVDFDQCKSRPRQLAVKLPLRDLSFDLKALHKEAEAVGNRERGHQQPVLAACKPGAPPAPTASKAVARFSYEWSRQFPDLKFLSTQLGQLGRYIHEYLCKKLGMCWSPEQDRDFGHVLRAYLVPDKINETFLPLFA